MTRRWVIAMAWGVVLVVAALLIVPQLQHDGSTPPGAGPSDSPTPAGPPNIVLILTDDQTVESVAKMPYLSSRTDWVRFPNAFDNVSLCCPARATILSGQYDTHTGVLNNEGPHSGIAFAESTALPVWLQKAGYTNALVGKYLNKYPFGRPAYTPPGWREWDSYVGAASYYDYSLDRNGAAERHGTAPADYATDVFTGIASKFLTTAKPPFFLDYAPHTPHSPYTPSPSHRSDLTTAAVSHDASFNEADVADKPAYIRALAPQPAALMDRQRRLAWAMNLSVDDAIKSFDATLAARGLLDSTVEVFVSDNGYAFGEHRWQHKRCEYDACMRIPLMIRMPGRAGREVSQLVSTPDIAATLAAVAGATPLIPADGRSLLPLVANTPGSARAWPDAVLEHWGGGGRVGLGNPPNFCAVRTAGYRYVRLVTGETELYDEHKDPMELRNVAADPAYASTVADLAGRLKVYRDAGTCDERAPAGAGATYQEEP